MNNYSIGQISKIVELPVKTIRFYEESGVITAPLRAGNGYRYYTESAIEELKILKAARDLGLPLKTIKKLIKGCEGKSCEHSQEYIHDEIDNYLQLLEHQILQFTSLKSRLQQLQTTLHSDSPGCDQGKYCCNILHQLVDVQKGGEEYE